MNPIYRSLICVFTWALWPILAKRSNLSPELITFYMCVSTAVMAMTFLFVNKDITISKISSISLPVLIFISFAGALNALGMVHYGKILSADAGLDISRYITMITSLIPVAAMIFALMINGEEITLRKVVLILIIVICVYLLMKK